MARRSEQRSGSVPALVERLEANPGDVDARKRLAAVLYQQGDRASAVREVLNVARILMHASQHAEALKCCREALAVAPEDVDARLLLAQIHARMPELHDGPRVALPTSDHEPVFELTPAHRVGQGAGPGVVRDELSSGSFEVIEEHAVPPPPPPAPGRGDVPTPVVGELSLDDAELAADDASDAATPATAGTDAIRDRRRSALNPFLDDPDDLPGGRRSLGPAEVHLSAEQLPANDLVRTLNDSSRHRLLEHLELVEYADGESVVASGRPMDRLVMITDGVVRATAASTTDRLPAGQLVGVFDVRAGTPTRGEVIAEGPVRALELRAERLDILIRTDDAFAAAFDELRRLSLVRALLERSPLFQSLSREQRADLEPLFFALDVQPGETVLKRGGINRRLFVVLDGELVIDSRGTERSFGRMPLLAGDFFGFVSTVLGRSVQVGVDAVEPSTLLVLPEQEVYRLVAANKGIARAARREAVERGDTPISVHRIGGIGGFEARRPVYT